MTLGDMRKLVNESQHLPDETPIVVQVGSSALPLHNGEIVLIGDATIVLTDWFNHPSVILLTTEG